MKRALFSLILLATLYLPLLAQEKFVATVDQNTVRVGESVTLTLTFSGGASNVPTPTLPALEKLDLAGGPFSNTSISVVNGRVASSASFSYLLRAREPGSGTIGESIVKVHGKEYHSQPIKVNILAGGAGSKSASGKVAGSGGQDVFLKVIPDKSDASLGEQITLTYKLYFAAQITNPEFVRLPSASGFWVEDIPMPQQLALSDEVVNGRRYRTAVIRKSALFATTAGDLDVEPLVLNTKVERMSRRQSRDPMDIFNDPFFSMGRQMEDVEVSSPAVKLRIRPLPSSDAPPQFKGAVGSYKISATLDSLNVKADQAVTLTVRIDGTGNIKTLPPPEISVPSDVERFDPEVTDDIRRNQAQISGSKTLKYVLIPRAPGMQVIPPIVFAFFNPQSGRYQTAATAELRLNVQKGDGGSTFSSGVAVATKHGVANIATDIAFAKTRPGHFVSLGGLPHQQVGFWGLSAAPWAILGASVLLLRQRERQGKRLVGRRGALLRAARAIALAEKALKGRNVELVLRHVNVAADEALMAGTDRSDITISPTEAREIWLTRGLNPALLEGTLEVQSECDRARFAASAIDPETARRLVERMRTVIDQLARAHTKLDVPS